MSAGVVGGLGVLVMATLIAADPPYVGRWKVNEDRSDYGHAFTFALTESGELRFAQGDMGYIVRFDGKDYPHPLGGSVRWVRLDDRSWETTYSQNGKVIGDAIYRLSADGQTLTTQRQSGPGDTTSYRRTSGERQGLVGAWSLKTAPVSIVEISVADGYDLVYRQGPAVCRARFDGREYPTPGPETCRISRAGDRGFLFTVSMNGKPVVIDTYTASEDGQTLIQTGGLAGQPPNHTIVHERQR